jgi:hypothetical protein
MIQTPALLCRCLLLSAFVFACAEAPADDPCGFHEPPSSTATPDNPMDEMLPAVDPDNDSPQEQPGPAPSESQDIDEVESTDDASEEESETPSEDAGDIDEMDDVGMDDVPEEMTPDEPGDGQIDEELVLALDVLLLSSETEPALNSTYSQDELTAMVAAVNDIWVQAGIRFDLRRVTALPARGEEAFRELRNSGERNARVLRELYDLSDRAADGWTLVLIEDMGALPPGVYFCDQQILFSGRVFGRNQRVIPPNVIAHELGHALGLEHACGQGENLMCADGQSPTLLWDEQIQTARGQADTGAAFRCQGR